MVSDLGLWRQRIGDPCEFCGEPTRDHTDGEARSCWADIRAREGGEAAVRKESDERPE